MATSRLLTSLHEFQSRFDAFERNRTRVAKIFHKTGSAWKKWQNDAQASIAHAKDHAASTAVKMSPTASSGQDSNSLSTSESAVAFDEEMKDVVRLLEETPTLVFIGQLKSGKSTLANVLLQYHILPSDEGPCTARMVKLRPVVKSPASGSTPSKEYLQLLKADGTKIGEQLYLETKVNSKGVPRLVIPQNVVDVGRVDFKQRSRQIRTESGEATDHGGWVDIYCHHPLLQFIHIVDSPGKGENDSLDQLVNDEVCHGLGQTLVYVIDACRGLTTKDKVDLKWIKNQLTEKSKDRGRIMFVCTRVDKALREDEDEPPPTVSPDDLPPNTSDGEEESDDGDCSQGTNSEHSDLECSDLESETGQTEACGSFQYSTRIHERIFEDLVSEGFLQNLEPEQLRSHDKCHLFHCVSAHAAEHFSHASQENVFVQDFLRFETCLAGVIVDNLNKHVIDALEELVRKQMLLLEFTSKRKFSLLVKAEAAEERLRFTLRTEDIVYKQLKATIEQSRFPELEKIIIEERDACLKWLPSEAGTMPVLIEDSTADRWSIDLAVANQVREFVADKLNERFRERVLDGLPVLNISEAVERCVKSVQDQAGVDLEATRLVTVILQAAYRPLSIASVVRQGLPMSLHIRRLVNTFRRRKPLETYTLEWKEQVARDFLCSLKANELATAYCAGVKETLENAHTEFRSSIKAFEAAKQSIVDKALGQHKVKIKELFELATAYLQSKSLLDSLVYGLPEKENEIGKGPISAVYNCRGGTWGSSVNAVLKVRKPWPPPVSREGWPVSLYFSIQCLDHDNIQKAIGFTVPRNEDVDEIWVLEERCLCSLEDVLQGDVGLDSIPWLAIGKNVIDGMLHLFCQGILHHNIKPSNVLLTGRRQAKLCDMGMYDIANMKRNKVTRAVYFVAPELASSETEGVATTDVYSIGILLWYLLKGYYESPAVTTAIQAIQNPVNYSKVERDVLASKFFEMVCDNVVPLRPEVDQWSSSGHKLKNAAIFIQKCWHYDTTKRVDYGPLRDEFDKIAEELRQ